MRKLADEIRGVRQPSDEDRVRHAEPFARSCDLCNASQRTDRRMPKHLRERYAENPDARFGLVASSRDRDLGRFAVPNDYQSTKRMRNGPWYGDDESAEGGRSCRHLRECVTEFGAQGLELDAVLLAWGTDFRREGDGWNTNRARSYMRGGPVVRDPWQLRSNAYRVLLTRARDATVVFAPPLPELDATYDYLTTSGFRRLTT